MTDYETVHVYEKLPRSILKSKATIDDLNARTYGLKRSREFAGVTRIRYGSRLDTELFALRTLLMNGEVRSFQDPKSVEKNTLSTLREVSISRHVYIHKNEYETAFDETVSLHFAAFEIRNIVAIDYHQVNNLST